jgi:simple sugar transport system permease protein/D-xylose transport system permease protein
MSASAPPTKTRLDQQDERIINATDGLRGALGSTVSRVRSGDLGAIPVIAGTVVIFVVFQILNQFFLSPANLSNLLTECAALGVIALGIVVVLLVAQIDLSVGSMSGVASAILGVGLTQAGYPLWLTVLIAIAVGAVVGLIYGASFNYIRMPSFVITLAGLLILLGLQLKILGPNGSINIPFTSPIVEFMQNSYIPRTAAYVLAGVVAGAYLFSQVRRRQRRIKHDLSSASVLSIGLKTAAALVVLEFATWYLNKDRGISAPFVWFVVLVVIMNIMLTRTRWGRSVFAVGGNAEAARRSGINVNRVYISVFMLCSVLAAVGGLMVAGRLATASISSGVGDTNLNAIAAAVIGGTSLFGGRGSAYSALLGIIVIAGIASGLTLLSLDASVRFMITGAVLFIAVAVDSLTRRSRQAHGKA